MTRAAMMKGSTKWNAKNRLSVGLATANPPQSHCTMSIPM